MLDFVGRIEIAVKMKHLEALDIVTGILNDVITSAMQSSSEYAIPQQYHDEQTSLPDQLEHENDGESLVEVTDAERESDDDIRIKILLGLLDLACAMVLKKVLDVTSLAIG